jgi:uncharacterized protein YqgC (DUF456 family)
VAALDATAGLLGAPDCASFAIWAAVLGGIIGAFMAVQSIQITNASLLDPAIQVRLRRYVVGV